MKIEAKVPDPGDAQATAQYIEAMARDLKGLATGASLGFLAYLLSMVDPGKVRLTSPGNRRRLRKRCARVQG